MERPLGGRAVPSESRPEPKALESRSCELSDVPFAAVFQVASSDDSTPVSNWHSPGGVDIAGLGAVAALTTTGTERFRAIRSQAEAVFERLSHHGPTVARPRAVGGFAFHDQWTDTDADDPSVWDGFGDGSFVVPRVQLTRSGDRTWLTVAGPEGDVGARLETWRSRLVNRSSDSVRADSPTIVDSTRSTDRETWMTQIERALGDIETTPLEKVVLAQAVTNTLARPVGIEATLSQLRRQYPDCYTFALDGIGSATFFGAPPERLVAKTDRTLRTEALAGSVPRGETSAADDQFAAELRTSEKLDSEHRLVVEAIRSQLASVSSSIDVGNRRIRRLATIQHLQTPITATLAGNRHVLDIVDSLHPTPAVGGVPQERACETIRSIESFDRGWYAAPVGWFDANGDGEFAVAIRSAVTRERAVTLFAGNGIVAGSEPDVEWDEVELKLRPILEALG